MTPEHKHTDKRGSLFPFDAILITLLLQTRALSKLRKHQSRLVLVGRVIKH